jgi:hypothetical protein
LVVVLFLITAAYEMTPAGKTARAAREKEAADKATYEAKQRYEYAGAMTDWRLAEKLSKSGVPWEEAKRRAAIQPLAGKPTNSAAPLYVPPEPAATSYRAGDIGETVTVRHGTGFWPCGSTTEAFNELMKWAVQGDNGEVKRTLVKTGSIGLVGGMHVKVIDVGFGKRKVRVLTNDAGETTLTDEQGAFPADPRIGRECWVVSEAVIR